MATANPTKDAASNETTPLLNAPATEAISASQHGHAIPAHENGAHKPPEDSSPSEPGHAPGDEKKPLPVTQILLLCHASLAEPIAYFAIFPFINEMIERTGGLREEDVGFWSGLIESLFSLIQMLLMIFYGRIADRLGRKPVLVFSLAGISGATALFGLSHGLWQMVLLRCFAGVFAGSSVTIRSMISENCTKRTQARAFSWYMFTRNLGIFLGPLIGGSLANPAEQFGGYFARSTFFGEYPYALATFVAGLFCLTTTLTCLLFLKETLVKNTDDAGASEPPLSTWEVLKSPGVPMVIFIYSHVMLLALAYTAVSPVFLYTSVQNGGFGFNPQRISLFLAVAGGSQALWMLLGFPSLQKRFGTGGVLRATAYLWPIMMVIFPVANELLRHGQKVLFWILLPINLIGGSAVSMAFACIQLCLNDIAPSPTTLATLNALALTVNSADRAVAPALFTSVFATGVKLGWIDGHLVWVFIVLLALLLNVAVRWMPEKAEGRPLPKEVDGDE